MKAIPGKLYKRKHVNEHLMLVAAGKNLVFLNEAGYYHTSPREVVEDEFPYYEEVSW
jgi:hypothetical protein